MATAAVPPVHLQGIGGDDDGEDSVPGACSVSNEPPHQVQELAMPSSELMTLTSEMGHKQR
jgi:hypothetical protein